MSAHQTIKVMLDTNVLISAVYNPGSTTFQAFRKASEPPYVLVLCDQVIDEMRRIFNRKFPTKIQAMERFLSIAHYDLVTLTAEDAPSEDEPDIRDVNDRPILRSALKAGVEILVTGDKDFLESSVKKPNIVTPSQFIQM
ncbi:MAG: putative toxin-antitoxin system toxin component, PIN family [Desulfosporosinus sp.]